MNKHNAFYTSSKPHVLMITNHGIHQWEIIPGLPDTGGQNVFVNQFTAALAKQGFKITVVNRGGYPHPTTKEMRTGLHYKDETQRILYLNDGVSKFIRKEDMDERLPHLSQALQEHFKTEGMDVDLIISHYWDGAKLGNLFNASLSNPVKHIWVPHSLGAVKKRNVDPMQWDNLRINERITIENQIVLEINGIASTSETIKKSLKEDYKFNPETFFLPPCVDPKRFFPHDINPKNPIWSFISQFAKITPEEIIKKTIITEISRTDTTKRKDILIKAFAKINQQHPSTLLLITIDQTNDLLAKQLMGLIKDLKIEKSVVVLGSVWNQLPEIYALTDIYCTPSIMEGFGMTPQEAAATKVPVISSDLVPFATEYLLGDEYKKIDFQEGELPIKIGLGAIIVPADNIDGFVHALDTLLSDKSLRIKMGQKAFEITIPYFTWDNRVSVFLDEIGNGKSEFED